ncbi:hypothetical protein MMC22_007579 [Lobaria immixta]|nr:hypothetical protein [Lobaria immixta]
MSLRVGLHLFQHGTAPRPGLLPERNDLSDADIATDASPAAPEVSWFAWMWSSPIGNETVHSGGLLSLTGISGPRTWLLRGHHLSQLLATDLEFVRDTPVEGEPARFHIPPTPEYSSPTTCIEIKSPGYL